VARLTAAFWVAAYRARLAAEGIPVHILHKGDETAGAVAVKIATMDGRATLFTRHYGPSGERLWDALLDGAPEGEVDAAVARQRRADPDLWVIEVEDPRGRHGLDAPGLEG